MSQDGRVVDNCLSLFVVLEVVESVVVGQGGRILSNNQRERVYFTERAVLEKEVLKEVVNSMGLDREHAMLVPLVNSVFQIWFE